MKKVMIDIKDYPEIDDFLIDGEELLISPEVEREIMEYMEKWETERIKNQAQAMIDARNIILGYDGGDEIFF
jgi:hypothetical protein